MCDGCGHPIYESQDADSEGRYTTEHVRCHACKAMGVAAEAFAENTANSRHGVKWRTLREE